MPYETQAVFGLVAVLKQAETGVDNEAASPHSERRSENFTCGPHLGYFRFTGLTTYHGSPRRLVSR